LELVNILAGQMNGAINLTVEGGATFTITFPAAIKTLLSKVPQLVIPAQAGIQNHHKTLDYGSSPE
jgi:hypothetical protein